VVTLATGEMSRPDPCDRRGTTVLYLDATIATTISVRLHHIRQV